MDFASSADENATAHVWCQRRRLAVTPSIILTRADIAGMV